MRVEAVLFDIDGTLLDHDRASLASLQAALQRERPGLGAEQAREAIGEWRRLEELHYAEYLCGAIAVEEQRRRRAAGMLRWLGEEARPPEQLEAWFGAFLDGYRENWAAFGDVEPALAGLERRGLALGAITNAVAELQRRKLTALGLEQRLPHFTASSEVGVAKSDPGIFAAACEALGLAPPQVAYVGDRLDTDARGARDAGLLGIWLKRDQRARGAGDVPTIGSLLELDPLL